MGRVLRIRPGEILTRGVTVDLFFHVHMKHTENANVCKPRGEISEKQNMLTPQKKDNKKVNIWVGSNGACL